MSDLILLFNAQVSKAKRGIASPTISWLLRDDFTDTLAAGSVNGTAATPGPGTRTVVDTGLLMSVSGKLIASGRIGTGDPGYWLDVVNRVTGRLVVAHINLDHIGNRCEVGWDANQSGSSLSSRYYFANGSLQDLNGNALITYVAGLDYYIAIVIGTSGCYYFIKEATSFPDWILLIKDTDTDNPLYPTISIRTSWGSGINSYNFIGVPDVLWLPTPLAYDTFTRADGALGNSETTGPDGQTVTARAWVDDVGTWAISTNKAVASVLAGGIALASVNATSINVYHQVAVTRSAGNAGIFVRYADANNYVYAIHDGANMYLIKRVGGIETTLITAATAYSAGSNMVITADGTAFRLYYNNALRGTEQTISDAGLQVGTKCGVYTSDTGNSFDNVLTMPRGNGGEYAALDAYIA